VGGSVEWGGDVKGCWGLRFKEERLRKDSLRVSREKGRRRFEEKEPDIERPARWKTSKLREKGKGFRDLKGTNSTCCGLHEATKGTEKGTGGTGD